MYGIGSTMSKQGNLVVIGTPVIQPAGVNTYTLYITLKNGGNVDVRILGFTLSGVTITISNAVLVSGTTTATYTSISGIIIKAGETVQLRITFSASALPSNIQGLLQTDAGNLPFQAILQ
jgi:copper(I)-binding protein